MYFKTLIYRIINKRVLFHFNWEILKDCISILLTVLLNRLYALVKVKNVFIFLTHKPPNGGF